MPHKMSLPLCVFSILKPSAIKSKRLAKYEIEGKLFRAYATTYFIYHGRMCIEITVKENGLEIFNKLYSTKLSSGINWIAQTWVMVRTLEANLQEVCKQFISDLNNEILNGCGVLSN